MKLRATVFACVLLAALTSCGGAKSDPPRVGRATLEAVYGSTLNGVQLTQSGDVVTLTYKNLPTAGCMLRLDLPEGMATSEEKWNGDGNTIHLIAPVEQVAEVGLVPTAGYGGEQVQVEIGLKRGSRGASLAPLGPSNVITDLTVTSSSFGFVDLAWTQMNVGDYDFNGEVNIADLTPLAPRINTAIDRSAAGANLQTAFWVDGDANGLISISDITPIGAHYKSFVHGYRIKHNGVAIDGQSPGDPTVLAGIDAEKRVGLPNRYHVTVSGLESDTWVVTPVDPTGNEGADSSGDPGSAPIDLNANLNIIGLDLRDLGTGAAGPFGPGKFSTRVIDPIDVVDRAQIGSTTYSGTTSVIRSLLRNRVYMIDFRFAPTVNLATGAPKGGASVKGTSAVAEDDIVTASAIFKLDASETPGDIDMQIEASPNPEGGYFLDLSATMTLPGDDPDTIGIIENGYTKPTHSRVYYAEGLVSRDTNNNGFDDNAKLCDPDRDGVGEAERARYEQYEDNHREDTDEIELEGQLGLLDLCDGDMIINNFVVEGGPTPGTSAFRFTETTEFIERTNQNEDGIPVDPSSFVLDEFVKVDLYPIYDDQQNVVDYWVEKVVRDLRT